MQPTIKRGGLLLASLAVLVATMALAAASASASAFCGGQKVNNVNTCWGTNRLMSLAVAVGESTGVCVGIDGFQGQCSPTGQTAHAGLPYGWHSPWVRGTASAFTVVSPYSYTT